MPGWTAPAARRRDRPRRRALPTMPRPRDPPGTATPRFRRMKAPPPRPNSVPPTLRADYLGKKTLQRLDAPLAAEVSAGSLDELTCFACFKLDDGRVAAIGQEIDHVESIASHRHVQWHIRGLEPTRA